jgi:hypothetical protein
VCRHEKREGSTRRLSKLAFCARSLDSTSTSILALLICIKELISIRFDSLVIFWSGADVNSTSRLAIIVALLEFGIGPLLRWEC